MGALATLACRSGESTSGAADDNQRLSLRWVAEASLNEHLPEGIEVFAAADLSIPLRAWYVRVSEAADGITTRVAASVDADGTETASDFSRRTSARVVVNGGYFRMDTDPSSHIGLLKVGGRLIEPAIDSVIRADVRYFTARAALGLRADGGVDIAWVGSRDGVLYELVEPLANAAEQPIESIDLAGLPEWNVRDAVAAGPSLLTDGQVRITTDEEVFFGSTIPQAHPRTAVGTTTTGELILLVVDGRQRESRGLDLVELAGVMQDLGCVEALNLDGGGSSTLVVDGVLINRPTGGIEEREIVSALTVFAE